MTKVLHRNKGYYVTKCDGLYHVWIVGITHSSCDSAYTDLSLAVARCDYLADTETNHSPKWRQIANGNVEIP